MQQIPAEFQAAYDSVIAESCVTLDAASIARIVGNRVGMPHKEAFALCQRIRLNRLLKA